MLFTFTATLADIIEKTTVYYFVLKPRCITCKKMEEYTKEAVGEIKSDKIEYKVIDLDKPENRHYKERYKLYTKSVVIVKNKNGKEIKYKNLDKIFVKARKKDDFKNYIKEEIKGL